MVALAIWSDYLESLPTTVRLFVSDKASDRRLPKGPLTSTFWSFAQAHRPQRRIPHRYRSHREAGIP